MEEHVIDIGDSVVCDYCNADFTNSDEVGGVLVGSYAVCPHCAPKALETAKKCHEPVDAICPEGVRFKDWVLKIRGGDNTIRIFLS